MVTKMFGHIIRKTVEVYIDDMLIKSLRKEDHAADLLQVFNILRGNRLRLNASKCTFGVSFGKFLDNISTKAVWDTLKEAFLESTNESRILLTTRYKSVAANSHADQSSSCHQLHLRTKDESWDLFEQMVHFPAESEQPSREVAKKFKALVSKVVGRCGGLPFSILRVGYLMSGKEVTVEELSRVLEHITHNQTPWFETLDINEKDLPLHLTQCLSYFGLFPRDFEIPARRLLALWVAEGLAQPIGGEEEESLESVAKKYLSQLIDRNLVQVVERKLNGDVKTCGFPSALRELWLRRHNRTTPTSFLSSSLDNRLAYYFDENDASGSRNHGSSIHSPHILRSCRNPRSFLFFDTREGNKPGQDIGNFLHRGIASGHPLQLQVLDLERVFRPQLPKNIGKLIQLTYLGLRWTYLEDIPESIGNLLNLLTLDVEHTYIRTLPGSIWKLQKLRHLYMNEIYRSKIVHQPRWNFLRSLQTLRGAFVDKDSPLKDGLGNLSNLRKLALAIQLDLSQQNALAENIVKLTHLESLKLKSIDEMGRPQELKVKSLSTLKNISSLYLFGKLQHPFIIIDINGLPQNLTDLTLSASKLSDDPIPKLEKLQKLKSLCLYCDSYTGKKMVWSKEGFPQLLVLKFWMLQELEDWDVKEQAMPNLKQLEIRSCKRLKVPNGLKHLKSLRELKLKDMPVEFTTTIKETKEQIWRDIAHSLAIIN
uniref:Uncharacterized protein n=1 Tax=Fagus sylvatica TaxID=28930 RepID=A0A2N9J6B9_FAGSY